MSDYDIVPSPGGGLTPADPWQLPTSAPLPTTEIAGNSLSPGGGAPQFFGYEMPGATPLQLQYAVDEIANLFLAESHELGISAHFVGQATNWFRFHALKHLPQEARNHHYNLAGWKFGRDEQVLNCFLNFAWANQATQLDVEIILRWLHNLDHIQSNESDVEFAKLERRNQRALEACERELRRLWGYSFEANLKTVARYVRNLPAAEREFIENDTFPDGTMRLNSPDVILSLYNQAVGVANIQGGNLADEIAGLEELMRNGDPKYWKSEKAQARLRALYQLRDGG